MRSDSKDLSGKIDPLTMEILSLVCDAAKRLGVDFFVVGATARDLILHYVYGLQLKRATQDIDLGVEVGNWARLTASAKRSLKLVSSRLHNRRSELSTRVECPSILPFGGIATEEGEIRWPPDSAVVMSMLGFREAYLNGVRIQVRPSPPAEVAVVSPVGLTMLKLIAWSEASADLRTKHATDLVFVVANYLDLGNAERVYDHDDLMDDFDYEITGARLLGRDLGAMISGRTLEAVLQILEIETFETEICPPRCLAGLLRFLPNAVWNCSVLSNSASPTGAETTK